MKLGTYLVFSLILLMTVPAYADVTSFKTDKSIYSIGDKIVFFGTSNDPGEVVNVVIHNPFGDVASFRSGITNNSGHFSLVPLTADKKIFDKSGTYEATAFGNTQAVQNGTRITLDFSNNKILVIGLFELKLNSIENKNIDEGNTLSFTATVTDPSITDLKFSLVNNPPGTSINPTTGKFTWTPTDAQGGLTYNFDIVVKAGSMEDKKTITIKVNDLTPQPTPTPKPEPTPTPKPEPEPEPKEKGIAPFVDPTKDPQYYINRYNNEKNYKDWFDKNYPDLTIYEAVGLENPPPPKELAPFVDPNEDPNYYINRYNNEKSYKEWFDKNYPGITIYEAVGLPEPDVGFCGPGTKFVDGVCKVDKTASKSGGGCLIATATFGTELSPQVQQLREIRDNTLLETESGSSFMSGFNTFYYSFSPTIADWERENPAFRELVKISITPMLASLSLLNFVDIDSESEMLGYGISIILMNIGMYFVAPAMIIQRIRNRR